MELVGVKAVDTSDTESFLIINCTGDVGGDVELSDLRFGSFNVISAVADGMGVVSGGTGKSGIADRGAALSASSVLTEGFRRGMSSSFHSGSVVPAFEFFRRDRRDIFRVMAPVASFAIELIDVFRCVGDGNAS